MSLVFFIVLFGRGAEMWWKSYTENWTTGTIWNAKMWKLYLSFPIGMFITRLQYIADVISLITKREMPFPGLEVTEEGNS